MTGHTNHPDEEQLVLFFYGEADGRAALESHVEACAECQAALRQLQRTLAAVDAHQVAERGTGYGAEVWARLQPQLEPAGRHKWLLLFTPRRLVLAGGLAVLLLAAFVAGWYSRPSAPQQAVNHAAPGSGPSPASGPEKVRDRVLLVAVGDHLERTQMVLVELMNRPAEGNVDITGAQEWARDLVPTNRLIRQTADQAGERMVSDVLDDLERVLVEIANSPSHLSNAEFEQVRERIEAQGIVFKIRVLDSQVRREQVTPQASRSRS